MRDKLESEIPNKTQTSSSAASDTAVSKTEVMKDESSNQDEEIAQYSSLLESNNEAAILCKAKRQNPNFLSIISANDKFYNLFSLGEDEVIGKNYDFMLDDLDFDSPDDGEMDHVKLIKMVKEFSPCLITSAINIEGGLSGKFQIAFNPINEDETNRFATLTFKMISNEGFAQENNAHNNNALRNLERRLRNESMLREIVSLIISDSTILDVARKVAKILCEGLKADRCILHDYSNSCANFVVEYASEGTKYITNSEDNQNVARYIGFQNHFFNKIAANTGKNFTAAVTDVHSDDNFSLIKDITKDYDISAQVSVTTTFKGSVNGGIYIHHSKKRSWLSDEIELISMVADQFSIAIERSVSLEKIMSANRDLTESSKKLQDSLEHEQEMRKVQSEFVALVSHEFKTPLQIIDSTREVMLRKLKSLGVDDDSLTKSFERVKVAIQRMNGLITSTLNLAKMENGDKALEMEKEYFNLHEFIEGVISKSTILASNKNVQVVVKIDELPRKFYGDPKLLDHTFSNVISNAVKYSRDNTTVKILAKSNEKKVALRVIDQGIGIPKEDLKKIGNKFFRAGNTMSVAGTGIGLYLAKHFVEMHGGNILIDSEVNVGSSFTVMLPIKNI